MNAMPFGAFRRGLPMYCFQIPTRWAGSVAIIQHAWPASSASLQVTSGCRNGASTAATAGSTAGGGVASEALAACIPFAVTGAKPVQAANTQIDKALHNTI